MKDTLIAVGALGGVLAAAIVFTTFERPPVVGVQHGYRGTGLQEIYNPRDLAKDAARNVIPASLPQMQYGPLAGNVYKNVQVLKNVHVGEFTRLMASMTAWVAPKQGCAYCHSLNNMASDSLYTKRVARRMLQMTEYINSDWKSHVQNVGVTCYTCHRGNAVPKYIWFHNSGPAAAMGVAEANTGKNMAMGPDYAALPYDPFSMFLEGDKNIRVQSTTALPSGDRQSIKQTEWTYALMIHMSTSLGVNCTYCHNTRGFGDWSQSSPQRVTAWYGIRLARDLNLNYLDPLRDTLPPVRWGPEGDGPKLNCATCHQGAYKPLYGVAMAPNFPELLTTQVAELTPPPAPAAAPETPQVAPAPPAAPGTGESPAPAAPPTPPAAGTTPPAR